VDMLFHFQEGANFYTGIFPLPPPSRTNSLLMQNIFVGFRMAIRHDRVLDIYLDSRGPYRSGKPDMQDGRRYFGVGGKLMI
jgi:hypothetical protein